MAKAPPTLLIDGDILLYQTTSSCEQEIDWGDDIWTLYSDLKECKVLLADKVEEIKKELRSPNVIFCISHTENFRKQVYPEYKQARKSVRKPLAYRALKEWVITQYPYACWPNLEADDVCGILATSGKKHPEDPGYIIVSEDKDLKTVPCTLYRQGELKTYSEDDANYYFLYQTLTGDTTDGYKGCPGVGDKTAEKLLLKFSEETKHDFFFDLPEAWEAVVAAYVKAGLTEADALVQARMARILRSSEWDHNKQQVKLWGPPKKEIKE